MSDIELIVPDGHDGLLAAVSALFPAPLRQRCLVHKQRTVMNAIPKREHQEVTTELTGIWKQEKQEDALLNLAAFKATYQKRSPEAVRSLLARRRACVNVLCVPAGDASLYSHDQRH